MQLREVSTYVVEAGEAASHWIPLMTAPVSVGGSDTYVPVC
jgi:hypothetical protein